MFLLLKDRRYHPWRQLLATTLADSIKFRSRLCSSSMLNEAKLFPLDPVFSLCKAFGACSYDVLRAKLKRSTGLLPSIHLVLADYSAINPLLHMLPHSKDRRTKGNTFFRGNQAGEQMSLCGSSLRSFQALMGHSPGLSSQLWKLWLND